MFNDAAMEAGATAITDLITHVSLHSTGAVSSSSDETAAGRVAAVWTVDTNGDATLDPTPFTGATPGDPVVRIGYWGASSGGTYYGGTLLSGASEFDSAGEYTVTGVTETASSS